MSGVSVRADLLWPPNWVRIVPEADINRLLDNLGGAGEQRRR